MFRSQAQLLNFEPQNGMLVLVYGRATIYERDGAFQLYADYMKPFGAGAVQMAFDALYKKLEAEGLFAPERKRPLPAVPRCIGVVTSKTGAAWQDVQNVIGRRWPMVKLLLAPVSVQGIEAEKSIVDGIRRLDRDPRPDLILVTRGGGSKEDLWVFNSERIARAAAACRRPVVSAVGHEIDTSILDYVADLRAPTPSAAAELCVPDQGDIRQKIFILQQNIQKNIQNCCNLCYNRFNQLATAQLLQRQHQQLDRRGQELAIAQAAVRQAAQRHVQDARAQPAKRRCGGGIFKPLRRTGPRLRAAGAKRHALRRRNTASRRGRDAARCQSRRRMPRGNGTHFGTKNRGVIPDEAAQILRGRHGPPAGTSDPAAG